MCYEPALLPTLHPDLIVWFDETHIEQEGGAASRTGVQIRFPRDTAGRFSPLLDNSTYKPLDPRQTFKFASEGRFCLGVAIILDNNGKYIGKKTKLFDYTSKKIDTIKVWNELVKAEYKRVKQLSNSRKTSPWIVDYRPNDSIFWQQDELSYLPGMGEKTIGRIREHNERIITIEDFIKESEVDDSISQIKGVAKFIAIAKEAKQGACTYPTIDHRQSVISVCGVHWACLVLKEAVLVTYRKGWGLR